MTSRAREVTGQDGTEQRSIVRRTFTSRVREFFTESLVQVCSLGLIKNVFLSDIVTAVEALRL